jgi:hypothetical protein
MPAHHHHVGRAFVRRADQQHRAGFEVTPHLVEGHLAFSSGMALAGWHPGSWLLGRCLMPDGYYQSRTRAAATARTRRGCRWRKIAARHLEGGKAMLAVRIDRHGNRAARSLDQVRVPGIAGSHALSDSGSAGGKMALPAGIP